MHVLHTRHVEFMTCFTRRFLNSGADPGFFGRGGPNLHTVRSDDCVGKSETFSG